MRHYYVCIAAWQFTLNLSVSSTHVMKVSKLHKVCRTFERRDCALYVKIIDWNNGGCFSVCMHYQCALFIFIICYLFPLFSIVTAHLLLQPGCNYWSDLTLSSEWTAGNRWVMSTPTVYYIIYSEFLIYPAVVDGSLTAWSSHSEVSANAADTVCNLSQS